MVHHEHEDALGGITSENALGCITCILAPARITMDPCIRQAFDHTLYTELIRKTLAIHFLSLRAMVDTQFVSRGLTVRAETCEL